MTSRESAYPGIFAPWSKSRLPPQGQGSTGIAAVVANCLHHDGYVNFRNPALCALELDGRAATCGLCRRCGSTSSQVVVRYC